MMGFTPLFLGAFVLVILLQILFGIIGGVITFYLIGKMELGVSNMIESKSKRLGVFYGKIANIGRYITAVAVGIVIALSLKIGLIIGSGLIAVFVVSRTNVM